MVILGTVKAEVLQVLIWARAKAWAGQRSRGKTDNPKPGGSLGLEVDQRRSLPVGAMVVQGQARGFLRPTPTLERK